MLTSENKITSNRTRIIMSLCQLICKNKISLAIYLVLVITEIYLANTNSASAFVLSKKLYISQKREMQNINQDAISGTLIFDGKPISNQRIILISEDENKLIDVKATDSLGKFILKYPYKYNNSKVILLITLNQVTAENINYVAVFQENINLSQKEPVNININSQENFVNVKLKIDSNVGYPEFLDVFVDPLKIEGISDSLASFYDLLEPNVRVAHFASIPIKGQEFLLKLRPGEYKIGGSYIVYERPMIVEPKFRNYIVNEATSSSQTRLPGDIYSGFKFTVSEDREIILHLREYSDKEVMGIE